MGFDDYADILLELIGNFDARSPLTIGIHGRWGSGKTSLMRMVEAKFEDDTKVKTVWFNAWAYGRDESIGLALLQQILNEFQKEEKLTVKGIRLIGNIGKLGTDAILRKTTTITLKEAENLFESSVGIKSTLRDDFEAAIDECLEDGGRLVVFIDDLDRCLPEKTIEILEVIKLFLDVPKCIFVIGVEKDVIERGIEVRYKSKDQKPISGQDYIEKIIQVPFTLPPIREEDMSAFIENLGIVGREKGYAKIVAKGTGCNPRKVKLFLNVLRIRQAIAERTGWKIEHDLSAKLFVFEYVFPEFYKDVVKYKHQDILCKLERLAKGDSDEKLEEELGSSELLKKCHGNEDLNGLLKDKPFFCGIDIEPYIYLSGTEAAQEVAASDESILDELLSGDHLKGEHAADAINKMSDSEKQQFLNRNISKLKDGAVSMRKKVARALGAIGDPRAVGALEEALKDGNSLVRRNSALALGQIGDAKAVEALEEALKDGVLYVRVAAADALGAIENPRAVEALVDVLKNVNEYVRGAAAEALGHIGDSRAVEALIRALKDEEEIVVVRGNAARALGEIGDAKAVEALKEALNDRDEFVRDYAAWALGEICDAKAVEALIEALKDEKVSVLENAAEALGKIGDAKAVDALMGALKDEDESVRDYAAWALGEINARQNEPPT
ncbi:MAG: HEAT repeat domain-containing protein [Euryarchaeota archaeon]|nr:HEAT repeat domain-containing protein [Euryarchaeota archaeon]MEA1998986.1 HEAT repeat domain-containing protein [Euryarchaeota archaeon]